MSFYGGPQMAASFRLVRGNTIRAAEDIPEDKYGFRPTPDTRTVAQLLAHIAGGPWFQLHVHTTGINDLKQVNFMELLPHFRAQEDKPRNKAELIAFLRSEGERFASYLEGLSDAFLGQTVQMPPGATPASKSRFEMLLSPKEHEMHHRGQLMLIQRMVGVVPHLTRQMQERTAAREAAASKA